MPSSTARVTLPACIMPARSSDDSIDIDSPLRRSLNCNYSASWAMFAIHRPLRQELLTVGNKLVALEMRCLLLLLELFDVLHEVIDSVTLRFGINGKYHHWTLCRSRRS